MPPDRPSFVARAGRDAAPPAATYDFSRPRAVSTRHLRALGAAHERLAAELSATLALALGEPVGVRALSTDEVLAADFVNSRTAPAVLFRMRLGAGGPALAVDLGPNWAAFLVQRHFGGQDALAPATEARATSALERSVLERRWLPLAGVAFADAWGSVPPVADAFAAAPAALDLGPLTAPVVVLELEITVGDETASMTVAYPAATVHTLLGGAALSDARHAVTAPDGADITALAGVPVDLRVVLGRASVPLGDLVGLQPGDVVPLGCTPGVALAVWSGPRVRFEARAGAQGRRLAIEITSVHDPSPDP